MFLSWEDKTRGQEKEQQQPALEYSWSLKTQETQEGDPFPKSSLNWRTKGRNIVYNEDLIEEDKTGGRNITKGFLHLKDKVLKCFLPSRKETLGCSLSLQLQGGRYSYLGGQDFRKEDIPRDLLILKDSPIRRTKDTPKDLLIPKDGNIRRTKDTPKDLLILKDGDTRRRTFLRTYLS